MVTLGSMASSRLSSARASSRCPRWALAATLVRIAETLRGWSCKGAAGPFDRLFEASRGEMGDADSSGIEKGIRIERTQTARAFEGLDRRLRLVAQRVDMPSDQPGVSRVWVERQGAIKSRRRHRHLAGQEKQRPGSLPNRFGVITLGFERLSRQAAGFAD